MGGGVFPPSRPGFGLESKFETKKELMKKKKNGVITFSFCFFVNSVIY